FLGIASPAAAQTIDPELFCLKNPDATDAVTGQSCEGEGLSAGGQAAKFGPFAGPGNNNPQPGFHDNGRGGNTFVNDPCLDPPPPDRRRTVQSETEIASFGKFMVAGFNDSFGFYDNRQGLSGVAYSVNGGNTWVDQAGLPPNVPDGTPAGTPGSDSYFGDPVVVVDKSARTFTKDSFAKVLATPLTQAAGQFYYASIYFDGAAFTLSVNRGRFAVAPPVTTESVSDTRCLKDPAQQGVPNTQVLPKERIVWERPSVAVEVIDPADFLDKEWLYVNQANGELYLTYTRFGADGSTPLELVRSFDGGRTWTAPTVIVPNLADTFNQATQPAVTSTGRLIVTWNARTFSAGGAGPESDDRIEYAVSDDDGVTFSPVQVIQHVNPQGEPPGYNRNRRSILDAPYINTYPHGTDVYVTYFNGKTPLQQGGGIFTGPLEKQADIFVASSHNNGASFTPVKVNGDPGLTSHVFPTVQVNKNGFVFSSWLDRRNDPTSNELTDVWANVSKDGGLTWGPDRVQTDVATTWRVRADARPNMGDYVSSELLNDNQFVLIWNDGRFPGAPVGTPPTAPPTATPDTIFTIANGLGVGPP
ncbi:MAG: hypothetical protein ACJ78Y_15960, partial [Myxococcales bacterium]